MLTQPASSLPTLSPVGCLEPCLPPLWLTPSAVISPSLSSTLSPACVSLLQVYPVLSQAVSTGLWAVVAREGEDAAAGCSVEMSLVKIQLLSAANTEQRSQRPEAHTRSRKSTHQVPHVAPVCRPIEPGMLKLMLQQITLVRHSEQQLAFIRIK